MGRKFPLGTFHIIGFAQFMSPNTGCLTQWSSATTKHSIKP